MTIYYISDGGLGSGLGIGSPFKFSDFMPIAAPGDEGRVLDGTFVNSIIDNTGAAHGTLGSPIKISAINDGRVFINGQGARKPVKLHRNYWILEGINAANSNADVYDITGSRNIIRRCIGWNANENDNVAVFNIYDGNQYDSLGDVGAYNLVEDCAGFGTGRKILQSSAGASHNTYRRCFARVEGSYSTAGPRCAIDIGYDSDYDTAENCVTTINRDRVSGTPFEDIGNFQNMGRTITGLYQRHTGFYGCIGYLLGSQSAYDSINGLFVPLGDNAWFDYVDSLIYIQPGTHAGQAAFNIQAFGPISNPAPGNRKVTRAANIGGDPSLDSLAGDVTYTDFYQKASVSALYPSGQSLYANSGNKPTIRYRYVDRTLTGDELFPWPMNQRIIDAMVLAGRAPIDVDATIQSIFGPFPAVINTYYSISANGSIIFGKSANLGSNSLNATGQIVFGNLANINVKDMQATGNI